VLEMTAYVKVHVVYLDYTIPVHLFNTLHEYAVHSQKLYALSGVHSICFSIQRVYTSK